MINRMNYLAIKTPDPAAAADFASKLGLSLVHVSEDGSHYLKGHGLDAYSLIYKPGDASGLDHVSYLVRDNSALEAARTRLEKAGVDVTDIEGQEWKSAPSLRFHTPAGHTVELTTGIHVDLPVAAIVPVPDGAPAPVACDHVGLVAPDLEAEEAFFTDTLGLLRSNKVLTPDGFPIMGFFRGPGSYLYHCVVIARGPEPKLHHYQFSMKNVDAFYAAYEGLKANGVDVEWGPLRHGPGHNIAMYFRDGADQWLEYSVEEEVILDDSTYVPRTWRVTDDHVVDEWHTGPPPAGIGPPPPPGGAPAHP
jgi:catechol 2,3-dioxygenase